ncbi:Uncharacterised protein [Mycobacterium tuberculosis]|nr:Uncharacterised protein [Mycobacterium tuberculosis]COW20375.1 Uncharacterised protein [Mycobacterium tuberculosis]
MATLNQPQSGPLTKPRVTNPSVTASSSAPRKSGMRRRPEARLSTSMRLVAIAATMPSGTLTSNTHRQPAHSTRSPPIGGPRPAAIAAAAPHRPIACARRAASKPSTTSASEAGTSIAAPMPCSTRNATNCSTLPATAHSPDAMVNTSTPDRNVRLRPSKSANLPAATMKAAKTML